MDQLRKQWRAREVAGAFHEVPRFEADGLVLGATVLAKARGADRASFQEGADARLKALLTAAYGQSRAREALNHVEAAIKCWSQGDEGRASMHLALSRLSRLSEPAEASRRLFMVDGLLRGGVTPEAILDALDFETPDEASTAKYSPDQPRVPAGRGRPSGQWTTGGGGAAPVASGHADGRGPTGHRGRPIVQPTAHRGAAGAVRSPAVAGRAATRPSVSMADLAISAGSVGRLGAGLDLGAMSTAALDGLVEFIVAVAETGAFAAGLEVTGAVTVLGVLFIPSTGPRGRWINVGGPGDVSYYLNPDEAAIRFKYTTADGLQKTLVASPDPGGDYRGPDGRVIARWLKSAAKTGLVVSTAALAGADTGRPNLCPAPVPDRPGGMVGRDYEDFGKKFLNPENPTPRGMGYGFLNPATGNQVVFDDCQRRTGLLVDYKGPNYAIHIIKDDPVWWGMRAKMLDQSQTQLQAAGGRPITWIFAEKYAADEVRELFRTEGTERLGITVAWLPWPEDSN